MCEVTLKIDESLVRRANPSLTDMESITRWAQHLMDTCIADLAEEEEYPLPKGLKPYTMEEIRAMIDEGERDIAEGRVYDFDDVIREIKEELDKEEVFEMAEAV